MLFSQSSVFSTYPVSLQCVFNVVKGEGLVLTELAKGVTVEDVKAATGCPIKVSDDLCEMKSSV